MGESQRLEPINLSRKTKPELFYLLKRQEALLANEKFVSRLPDKGEKLRNLKRSIEEAISEQESIDATTQLVQRLTISNSEIKAHQDDTQEYGDKTRNTFAILALNELPRKIVIKDSETKTTLESESKVIEVDSEYENTDKIANNHSSVNTPDPSVWTKKLEDKQDVTVERKKLNRSVTEIPTKTSATETSRSKYFVNGVWIETGVTPPPAKFTEAKAISYEESYRLQKEQAQRQSELHVQVAAANLISRMNLRRIDGNTCIEGPSTGDDQDEEDAEPDVTDEEESS